MSQPFIERDRDGELKSTNFFWSGFFFHWRRAQEPKNGLLKLYYAGSLTMT